MNELGSCRFNVPKIIRIEEELPLKQIESVIGEIPISQVGSIPFNKGSISLGSTKGSIDF